MASGSRRRLERLLRKLDAHDVQRCAVVHIPWHTSQADYDTACGPRSWDRPLYAFRGGFKGAGASSTDSNIATNIERGF
jgi:hypothetical protein